MQLTDAQRLDWLRLIRAEGIGPRTFRGLVNRFGGAGAALEALPDLARARRKPIRIPSRAEAEREVAAAAKLGVRFVALGEEAYPAPLRATDDAPPLIALRGEAAVLARPCIAVVGSRNASAAGMTFAERLAQAFGAAGFCVVSGLARGIDARAHAASLATGTAAVLAGGQDRIYPAEHEALAARILAQGGAIVAEMPLGWEPRGRDFPRRNRIISGLCLGTVVVEAARRSGSLITARFALEQGREVFAVPGSPLDPRAEGTNDLIRQGATLCGDPDHVLSVLMPLVAGGRPPGGAEDGERAAEPALYWDETDFFAQDPEPAAPEGLYEEAEEPPPPDDRARLLALLGPSPVAVDALGRQAGLSARSVQGLLLELELDGLVTRHGGGSVSLR
ncbi:DNA protecting protein DprA [Methylobacterium sp. 4-46]|uniref:DNA-processing protein DprA n=1 Tax=unclassified Methylobacterium TaxID=2615210 RepID=UPI000152BE0B|nr:MULTISPECIES: DNA-processing protein DprA [Methylobacterium]ACA18688.1 DNA protecting protein DprA [Methylobacterium sp. 4-46]WFT77921.1 DNA-processing protein DprA [Methylobacterium nodulans]